MLEMAPSTLQAEPNAAFQMADHPDAFFLRDVVCSVDGCCFQVIDGLWLSQEHPIFQVCLKLKPPTDHPVSKVGQSQSSDSPAVWGGAPSG